MSWRTLSTELWWVGSSSSEVEKAVLNMEVRVAPKRSLLMRQVDAPGKQPSTAYSLQKKFGNRRWAEDAAKGNHISIDLKKRRAMSNLHTPCNPGFGAAKCRLSHPTLVQSVVLTSLFARISSVLRMWNKLAIGSPKENVPVADQKGFRNDIGNFALAPNWSAEA